MSRYCTIATIALETGISKEVLRKWEERYGFPVPERDASGHRVYAEQQTIRLKLIKRLIDAGMRPAQVVSLDEAQLQSLLPAPSNCAPAAHVNTQVVADLMRLLYARDRLSLAMRLRQEITQLGLEKFVLEVMSELNDQVGAAWERGEIGIRDEHMYSEVIQGVMREHIAPVARPDGQPCILVTTPDGELHTLGILMVDALVSLYGASCISLGAQTPLEEIPHAISDYHADIVCLSFSAAFPKRRILPLLKVLRNIVPKSVEIWIGGAGAIGLDRSPRGINVLLTLPELIDALHKYRRRTVAGSRANATVPGEAVSRIADALPGNVI